MIYFVSKADETGCGPHKFVCRRSKVFFIILASPFSFRFGITSLITCFTRVIGDLHFRQPLNFANVNHEFQIPWIQVV